MVDMDEFELAHLLNEGAAVRPSGHNPAPPSTINTGNTTSADIDISFFLKYVNVKLPGRTGVLNFYDNLCVKSKRFNILLCPSNDIHKLLGVVPSAMDPDRVSAMGTALHSKMSQVDIIDKKYKNAHNLLQTTDDVYVFLQLLIQQVHPLLAIKTVATMDIPRDISYNDLYRYAKEIVIFVKTHALHMHIYTPVKTTQFFLTHLDNTKLDTAV